MQNKYVGDIGDYCKLGLLRWLSGVHLHSPQDKLTLGVCWYAVPDNFDPQGNRDGRHIEYLGLSHTQNGQIVEHIDSAQLSQLDCYLWESLRKAVLSGRREIPVLESIIRSGSPCVFHSTPLPTALDWRRRLETRNIWFKDVMDSVGNRDFLFIDPDNGLASEKMRPSSKVVIKHVLLDELKSLSELTRAGIVIYHHLGKHLSHENQIAVLKQRLECFAHEWNFSYLIFNRYSCRAFILLSRRGSGGGQALSHRFESFIQKWKRPEGAVVIR